MRVGIDLDNCVYPFAEEFTAYVSHRLGVQVPMYTHWNSHQKHWALSHDQMKQLMHDALEDGELWWNAAPITGAVSALWELMGDGHKIVIATDRLQGTEYERLARQATFAWLKEFGVPHDEVHFTAKKEESNPDIFIDDRPGAVPSLLLAGIDAVYYTRPWNEAFPYPRVNSWNEFVEYVRSRDA